eukprot:TRINITY_DN2776_c1_g1_i2.p1 TRINITY_DN2776_c1_g1~~TRINITY_DN2776_c1_g1_i2.p1  ORF type:complete len:420 (-),score=81.05 TRINITY_DN2776_c1_g1_i2:36-1295(-)
MISIGFLGLWKLCNKARYAVVYSNFLMEIACLVLVKEDHWPCISQIRTSCVATGIANVVGNKGGVGISFCFHNTSLLFISAHLSPHQEKIQDRNKNYKDIARRMRMGDGAIDFMNKFHYVFFFGDLNYRIALPFTVVIDSLLSLDGKESVPQNLIDADQLKTEMEAGRCFEGFEEMKINFLPTYRLMRTCYDENGNRIYNNEKSRIPSWCDRILWHKFPGLKLKPCSYYSTPTIDSSDHVPVSGIFEIPTIVSPYLLSSALMSDTISNRCFATLSFTGLKALGTKWRNRGGGAGNPSNGGVLVDEEKEKKDKKLPCPYLRFVASFLPQHLIYQTKPDFYTETPTWESIDLQVMDIPNLMYLKTQHMILLVVSSEGRVEPLGQSVLSLDDIGPLPKRLSSLVTSRFPSSFLNSIRNLKTS